MLNCIEIFEIIFLIDTLRARVSGKLSEARGSIIVMVSENKSNVTAKL